MRLWLGTVCLCLAAGSQAFGASQNQREHGAELFVASGCRHCHTIHNVGGHKGPDLSGVGRVLSKDKIREQILNGGDQMPPFMDDLEAAEVNDLIAYLRSCREKPKKPQSTPALHMEKNALR
jgi:mono/diheme cytochrome c family protein